ncbi:ATP-dependent helicase [Paenibacillaceae bacterium]|nr:ATP-dependent helicase [Paenibacillaceae bacterium]
MKYAKAQMSNGLTSLDLVSDTDTDSHFFRKLEELNIKLNSGQIELVRHRENFALVNAVAGAGKSSTVVSRLSYLNKIHKVDLSNVLLITFTKTAAKEMIEKAVKLGLNTKKELSKVTAGTFHSFFLKILRENGEERGILSSDKSKQITIKMITRSLGIDEKKYRPEDILSLISSCKNQLKTLKDYRKSDNCNLEIYKIWNKYEEYKRDKDLLDFDDMGLDCYHLLKSDPSLLESIRNRYQYIMVDEAQDTNLLQFEIIEMITAPKNNLVIIGDSDQCVFSFNGARIQNILNFPKRYPETKIIMMNTNYRSTNTILGLANDAIKKNKMRLEKESLASKQSSIYPSIKVYESADHEAAEITKKIKEKVKLEDAKYSDFAIIYRTNSNSRAIFEELLLSDVPFITSSTDDVFYENSIVKPLLAFLRVIADPYDFNAIGEVLPTMYIRKDKIVDIGKLQKQSPIARPIEHVLNLIDNQYAKRKVADKLSALKRIEDYKPIIALKVLREDYEKYLIGDDDSETTSLHREIIIETLDELENSSKRYEDIGSYIRFVNRVIKNAKKQKESKGFGNKDAVKLMTIHKSKGLEYKHVFGILMNETVLPHSSALNECSDSISPAQALEEENRLFYVLVTRAEEELNLSFVQQYRNKEAFPSRFITDYIDFEYGGYVADDGSEEEGDEEEVFDLWNPRRY